MQDEEAELIEKLKILREKSKIAEERLSKYKNMTFAQVIQEPENLWRLERCEKEQKQVFQNIIKKRHELKHLKDDWKDLFAEYFTDFLNGKVLSINDFFYEGCKDLDMVSFFKLKKKELKEKWKEK